MATQQGIAWLIQAGILLAGSAAVLFGIFLCALTASADVLYEEDFSSDPGWVSDGSDNFSWNDAEGVYSSIFINGPQVSPVDRFAGIQVPFDPTQPFALSWKQRIASSTGSFYAAPFGLLSPGLMGSTTSALYGDGMVQYQYGVLFGDLYAAQLDVRTNEGTSLGGGGITSTVPDLGAWYRQEFRYDAATHSLTHTITNESSGAVLSSQTVSQPGPSRPLFGTSMQYIGMSYHPYVSASSHLSTQSGMVEVWIDDIKLEDGNTEEPPQLDGASSVLFLPGIQASRLYKDGVLGTEDQIWEPNINNDVGALAMNEEGESVNQIYTRDIIDEIALPFVGENVYKDFLGFLEDLKDETVIKEYVPFAYDWRYDVTDIAKNGTRHESEVKSLVNEIERLASTSFTGKVTIIGHSNGGLVGKALISELEVQGKAYLVDKLVMVGTPQLGAPKAIAVMLHGYDQLAVLGHVVDDDTAREVIRNMPGTYTLLPSTEYFEKAGETLVSADISSTTASVRAYGPISTKQQLNNFVLDSQNRRNDTVPIYEPSTLNSDLLQQSLVTSEALDEWLPPDGVAVYEIVGTGIPTVKAFEYRSFPCYVGVAVECTTGTYMKAVPILTDAGDETVTTLSASGQDGAKVTGYVDLVGEPSNILIKPKSHFNLTESPTVQTFVDSIIKYPYIAPTLVVPEFTDVSRVYKIVGVHSPVSFSLTDSTGKQTGIVNGEIKEDIFGSQYLKLGDSTYVIVPDDVSFTANLKGEAIGVYSLTIDKLASGGQAHLHRYIGASTTPAMQATFTFANNTFSNVVTDLNGDGTTDMTSTIDGQIIPPPVVYSYALLRAEIKALRLPKLLEAALLVQVEAAAHWDMQTPKKAAHQKLEFAALDTLKSSLRLYKKKGLITQAQLTALEVIINNLRN